MKPEDQKRQEYIETLVELQDRMTKAGLILSHAQSNDANAVEFTPVGSAFITAFDTLDKTIGPLTNRQVLCLWSFFREFAKHRPRGHN